MVDIERETGIHGRHRHARLLSSRPGMQRKNPLCENKPSGLAQLGLCGTPIISVSVYNLEPRKQPPSAGTRRHTVGRKDNGQLPRPRIERSSRKSSSIRRKPVAPSGTKNGRAGGASETSQADEAVHTMHQIMSIQEGIPMGFQVSLKSGRVRDLPSSESKEPLDESSKVLQDPGLCRAPIGTIQDTQRNETIHPSTMLPSTEASVPVLSAPKINDKPDPCSKVPAQDRGIGSLRPPGYRRSLDLELDLENTHSTNNDDKALQGHASPPEKCCSSNDDPAEDGSHPALPVASLDDAEQPENDMSSRLPGRNDAIDCNNTDNSTEDEPGGNENAAGDPQRASMTGAIPRVVAHLKSQRNRQSLTKTWPSPSPDALAKNKQTRSSAKAGGRASSNDASHSYVHKKITRARSFFDPEAEARKAEERLVARRKQKLAEEQAAVDEEIEKRRANQARKTQAAQDKEARRLRIYACNAILTQNEWANIELVMKMMREAEASEAAGADGATAEMLAEMATNSV